MKNGVNNVIQAFQIQKEKSRLIYAFYKYFFRSLLCSAPGTILDTWDTPKDKSTMTEPCHQVDYMREAAREANN